MDFLEIANLRQSCRSYDESRPVEEEKLTAILRLPGWHPLPATASPTTLPSAGVKPPKMWPC